MKFAEGVKANTNLWRLNSWYRGIRKSITPSLKRLDSSWASSSQEKVELLSHTWFPPPAQISGDFFTPLQSVNPHARPFISVTYEEIQNALKGTSNTSPPGLLGLNYKVLKWAFMAQPDELVAIIRASVKLGIHHPQWKSSLVVAIPKPGKKDYSAPRSH